MKKLDLYIIKKFLGTFFFILMLLIIIAVVVDFSEKVDNFIEGTGTVYEIIFEYFFNFIPHIAALLGPLFVLVSVVFMTSQLAGRSEIIAMTSGGVSFYRLMVPYLIAATILGGIQYYTNHYWVPNANKIRLKFEEEKMAKWQPSSRQGIHRKLSDDTYLYISKYNMTDSSGIKCSIETFDGNQLISKTTANKMEWNSEAESWRMTTYFIRTFEGEEETFYRGETMDTVLNISPIDFERKISSKEMMTTPELNVFIKELQEAGQEYVEFYQLEKYRRTSSVFSTIILTIIGLSIASRKIRGGMGIHIMAAIVLGALFELTMKFSTTLTTNADMHPFLGVWMPNIIFAALAVVLVRLAQK